MRRYIGILITITLLLLATPVLAAGFAIGPPEIELEVPANGSAVATFYVTSDFDGELQVSLEDIPLRVEPTTIPITKSDDNREVQLTFYGNESLGSQVFDGKVRFLALTGGNVATGVKVKATVNHIVAGQPLPPQTGGGESFTMPLWGWIVIGIVVLAVVVFAVSRRLHIEVRRR